ncbi:SUKH-4 family immunity protein [Streptomyces sp. NBC_00160]|uniref:SUKH-4 family immunity protein n=1 Tax=Streptomyces TaxID=1883 RepID=UPI00224F5D57|nr:SUKH-4 family immunity protein [Streptomyces sp. NBC_00160]MCX5308202.1 SUKH-4 family immunity protein [Streptomyces sp. NBC_00160]
MNFTVTSDDLINVYGLGAVSYFPHQGAEGVESRTADFLSSVGLPTSDIFTSRMDVEDPYGPEVDAITIGSRFDHYGLQCPDESRSWWSLGYLFTSLLALDPACGKVYAFPEGAIEYIELHRDIESLVFALIELRKVEIDHDIGADPEELATRFRECVEAFDPIAFADEESQWILSMEELEQGIW